MNSKRKFGALSSSTDPEKLGNTVRASILGFASVIIFVTGLLGVPLAETDIAEIASQAGLAASSVWFLYGVCQKLVVGVYNKFSRG